jgi:hypothetical protein
MRCLVFLALPFIRLDIFFQRVTLPTKRVPVKRDLSRLAGEALVLELEIIEFLSEP